MHCGEGKEPLPPHSLWSSRLPSRRPSMLISDCAHSAVTIAVVSLSQSEIRIASEDLKSRLSIGDAEPIVANFWRQEGRPTWCVTRIYYSTEVCDASASIALNEAWVGLCSNGLGTHQAIFSVQWVRGGGSGIVNYTRISCSRQGSIWPDSTCNRLLPSIPRTLTPNLQSCVPMIEYRAARLRCSAL